MPSRPTGRLGGGVVALLAGVLLLAACGTQGSTDTGGQAAPRKSGSHAMSDGSTMSDAEMAQMDARASGSPEDLSAPGSVTHRGGAGGPSAAAAMICSLEIARAVRSTFELARVPSATDGWSGRSYTCTYRLPAGELRLSVEDLDRTAPGKAWFAALEDRLGARRIRGVESLGFPAAETPRTGHVLFLKDDKTLHVDASGAGAAALPSGVSRTEAAYGVAASVIACWTE